MMSEVIVVAYNENLESHAALTIGIKEKLSKIQKYTGSDMKSEAIVVS